LARAEPLTSRVSLMRASRRAFADGAISPSTSPIPVASVAPATMGRMKR
jgi:hypothetical protein